MSQTAEASLIFEKTKRLLGQYRAAQLSAARLFTSEMLAGHEWCQPLNAPLWRRTADHMNADDPVLGLYLNGQAWALPWWVMKNHHVANLMLNGQPILVTLCEMCSSSAAFYAYSQAQRYTFRLAGQYNGTILIADSQTDSLWSPFMGKALAGTLKGTALTRLPLYQCLWKEWQATHTATWVLYGPQTLRQGHGSEFYPGSPGLQDDFCQTLLQPLDERLPHNTLVLGVEGSRDGKAYPLSRLDQAGYLLEDQLGPDAEIVILHEPSTWQALAFSRRVGHELLTFEQTVDGKVYDKNSGTRWNLMGEAIAGALAGHQLTYLPSGVEEWYVWAAYHPSTTIYDFEHECRVV